MSEPLMQFQVYQQRPSAIKVGSLVLFRPRTWPGRLLARALKQFGVYLGHSHDVCEKGRVRIYGDKLDVNSCRIEVAELLKIVREQLYWAQANGRRPTKIIVGPDTFRQIAAGWRPEFDFYSFEIPPGVPLLMGMELVINPCIEGVALG